jgi:UDP-N-acetylglucosamine 2-epimerase (non-hydrolysing)
MICIVLGTRPEIIKMSPIIRECEKRRLDYFILHTGQHYSYEMDRIFFEELGLPAPGVNIEAGSGTHGAQTGEILGGVERELIKRNMAGSPGKVAPADKIKETDRGSVNEDTENVPDIVLVQGDTNTVLAGALAAVKLHIPVGHVEAGLRSFDRNMPEEINRVVADHISDLLFAPTETARLNLMREGLPEDRIFVTGNTVVDAVYVNLGIAEQKFFNWPDLVAGNLHLEKGKFALVTAHRAENVDTQNRLQAIFSGLGDLHRETDMPVVFPVHPRTAKMMEHYRIIPEGVVLSKPVGYLEFLRLESNAGLILTDSGGIQEESCILRVPCVTLRDTTERPETLAVGSNILAGADRKRILESSLLMLQKQTDWENPYGDGHAGSRIVGIIKDNPGADLN